ncbi:MAG: ROK family protein, partial [Anaerolineae bacterium]
SGIIVNGEMLLGAHGLGAEAGHIIVDPRGPQCGCGHFGCLETFASGTAIARHVVARIKAGKKTRITKMVGGDLAKVDARVVGEAAKLGDKLAIQAFQRAGKYLGIGIASLLRLFNPTMIVLGGSVTKAGALLLDPMWAAIKEYTPAIYWEGLSVVQAALGDDVGLLGAVVLAASQLRIAIGADRQPAGQPAVDLA